MLLSLLIAAEGDLANPIIATEIACAIYYGLSDEAKGSDLVTTAMLNILNRDNISTNDMLWIYKDLPDRFKSSARALIPMLSRTKDPDLIEELGRTLFNLPTDERIYIVRNLSPERANYYSIPAFRNLADRILDNALYTKVEQFSVMEQAADEHGRPSYSLPNNLRAGMASYLFGFEEERARGFVEA